jgi:hypothetical protein
MAKDDDEKPPRLKVVSENPNLPDKAERARAERAEWDRRIAEQTLAQLAATILRTMAGSTKASYGFLRCINDFIDAHNRLRESSGSGLTLEDEQRVLTLRAPDYIGNDDFQYRRAQIDDAYHTIVQGALRLAAHQVLGEDPHFGGKYSKRAIDDGMRELRELRDRPPAKLFSGPGPRPKSAPPKAPAVAPRHQPLKDPTDGKKKRWSPMDSKSWRDVKKEE